MRKTILFLLCRGALSVVLVASASCGKSSGGGAAADASSNPIPSNKDAPLSLDNAGPPDGPSITYDVSVQTSSDSAGDTPGVSYDGGDQVLPIDPSDIFPDCKNLGTLEATSECIINLPTSGAIAVTRSEPMDFSLCKP